MFKSYFYDYFIKVYDQKDFEVNKTLSENFMKLSKRICLKTHNGIRAYSKQEKKPLVAVLIDAYPENLNDLIRKKYFSTIFDIYKFIIQICCFIRDLEFSDIRGIHLNGENVVVNINMDFQITHFDEFILDINEKLSEELLLAPEIYKNKFERSTNLWDLGILLYKILFKQPPKINYKTKEIKFSKEFHLLGREYYLIKGIIEDCLKWNL